MQKVNIGNKFSQFEEYWSPKIVGELNGQCVKIAKLKGEFVWHKHDNEDELFYILKGTLKIEFRDHSITLHENEIVIVPRGTEHKPVAENEVYLMLFEPASTLNTGDQKNEFTISQLDKI
ncbi:MAG: cupin domain-containing protein [Saprospiraceae bacterium]|nr:cupin domain-containing protein [Saprospiraceae bacterium]